MQVGSRRARLRALLVVALLACAAAPSAASAADYVALGDSYASGTGTRAYYEGCERSGRHGAGGDGHIPEFSRVCPCSFNRSPHSFDRRPARARSRGCRGSEGDEEHSRHVSVTGADRHGGVQEKGV